MRSSEIVYTIDSLDSPTLSSLRGISVSDSSVAWLSGANGTILRTINGGKHWEQLSPPDLDSLDFRSIVAFGSTEAIIASAGYPSRVYKTIDAGQKWTLVHENLDSAAFMNSIAFKNDQDGIIAGDQLDGRHLILITKDGGDHWARIDSLGIPQPLINENGFAASGSCIAISPKKEYLIALGGGHSRVFTSSNGIDWKADESQLKTNGPASGIYSIAAAPHATLVVGGDYTKADSAHQAAILFEGKSWKKNSGYLNGYRSVIDYSISCDCWLSAGINGIDVSYNNGQSWKSISNLNINTLQFTANSGVAYAANSQGKIYKIKCHSSTL